jgi:thymidylate synthase
MNRLDKQYQALLQDILDNGVRKEDRTGTGTISVFGRQIRHKMSDGFPLLTTKRMAWKQIVVELLWFLRGDTNVRFLIDNGCHIWDGDAYKRFEREVISLKEAYEAGEAVGSQPHIAEMFSDFGLLVPLTRDEFIEKIKSDEEFAKKWGELGPIYGKQWRQWSIVTNDEQPPTYENSETFVDQIKNLIDELKANPDSRRLMVSAWNVAELNKMVLPPCHYGFQVYTRELSSAERWGYYTSGGHGKEQKLVALAVHDTEEENQHIKDWLNKWAPWVPTRAISLMWNQRSVDTFLGLPFNIASYGLLLMMLADELQMVPDELIGNLGDTHLYLNHLDQAMEQILRAPYPLPKVHVRDGIYSSSLDDLVLIDYKSHPPIKAPLSN